MANGETTMVTRITSVERMGTSYYGNPYYRLHIVDEPYVLRTSIDSGMNYGIDNAEFRTNDVELRLTRAGRVFAAKTLTPREASMAKHPAGKGRK